MNPFLWLASRNRSATIQAWIGLGLTPVFWSWLAWQTWAWRGVNVTIVFVIAIGASWLVQFLIAVPAEASRRLLADRQSGALELLLCTPLAVESMIRGQWLALYRRYLPPLILAVFMSLALMLAGYFTNGFGGLLDPEDKGPWLGAWLAGIGLLPLALRALCWASMRRALFARDVGEASGIAFIQVIGVPCFVFPSVLMLLHSLARWNPDWWVKEALVLVGFAAAQLGFAWRARTILFRDMRHAAASRYRHPAERSEGRFKLGVALRTLWASRSIRV